jgi:hypothetical protein
MLTLLTQTPPSSFQKSGLFLQQRGFRDTRKKRFKSARSAAMPLVIPVFAME